MGDFSSDLTDHFGTDEFGFSALPGGIRSSDGSFGRLGAGGYWWSSAVRDADTAIRCSF